MYQLTLENMHCMSCARRIEQAIKLHDQNVMLNADVRKKQVSVETTLPEDTVRKIIRDAGYIINDR